MPDPQDQAPGLDEDLEIELEAHFAFEGRDPADVFEDELARLLGYEWAPHTPYDGWQTRRRRLIEAHPDADAAAGLAERAADRILAQQPGWP